MTKQLVLIVEDEAPIREMLRMPLERAGYEVLEAENAEQGQELIYEQLPNLILLDWMLPGMSGIDFIRRLRKEAMAKEIPVIMITAKIEEADKIRGLDVGADDYITKPFSPRELMARIKAVLRRSTQSNEGVLNAGNLQLFPAEHRVTINDEEIHIGPTEFRLLHFFMSHPERVYSRTQVLDHVWGGNVYIEERTVDVHIRRLRKALAEHEHDHLVQTVRGVGYRFSVR